MSHIMYKLTYYLQRNMGNVGKDVISEKVFLEYVHGVILFVFFLREEEKDFLYAMSCNHDGVIIFVDEEKPMSKKLY